MAILRREDTAAGFISGNPILTASEHGSETDTEAAPIAELAARLEVTPDPANPGLYLIGA